MPRGALKSARSPCRPREIAVGYEYLASLGGIFDRPAPRGCRADQLTPEAIGVQVLTALRQFTHELAQGVLLTVEPGRARASLLPLPTRP